MAAITETAGIPSVITAGNTYLWTDTYADHPASTWGLTYVFRKEGQPALEVTAVASSDAYTVTLSASESSEMVPGKWKWYAIAEKTGQVSTADSGTVQVYPDVRAEHVASFAEKALVMIEASLANDMPTAQESISILGSDITKMGISERYSLRDKIKAEVGRERQRRHLEAGGNRRGMQVRFIR